MSSSLDLTRTPNAGAHGVASLSGGGLMGSLIRAHDWTSTLGRPETWSPALLTAVQTILSTAHPAFLFWGPKHICLYNDGYVPFLGPERHPGMLGVPGRIMWNEIWDTVRADLDVAMSGRQSTWREDFCIPLQRSGKLEELYWTFSYTPVMDDTARSGIGGAMVITAETTAKVIRIKVQDFRLRLEAQLRELADTFDICSVGSRMLGEFLGASRCGYVEVDACNDSLLIRGDWTDGTVQPLTGNISLCEFGPGLVHCRGAAQLVEVDDPTTGVMSLNMSLRSPDQYGLAFPLTRNGRCIAALHVFRKAHLAWNQQYRELIRDVAVDIQAAVERSRIFRERERIIASLRASDERYRCLVESSNALVWELPADGKISAPQSAWQEFTGQSCDEQRNWGWLDAVHAHDQDRVVETLGFAHDAQSDFQMTYRLRDRAGGYRQMHVHAAAVKNPAGALHGWIAAHREVSAAEAD